MVAQRYEIYLRVKWCFLPKTEGRKEQGREKSTKTPLQDAKQAKGHSKWQK